MTGIVKVGTGLGIFIMPLVESRLISAYGWRNAFLILGIVALFFLLSTGQLLRRDPAQKGVLPDGDTPCPSGSLPPEQGLAFREAIHTKQFWTICIVYATIVWTAMTVLIHIPPHAIDLGISPANAAGILSTIGAVSMAGRLAMGRAGDRIGSIRAMAICFMIMLCALILLQVAHRLWLLYSFGFLYGFAHGGLFALISPAVASLFGTRSQGTLLGLVAFSGTGFGGTIGPLLTGYVFDVTRSYRFGFLLIVVLIVVGLVLTKSLRPLVRPQDMGTFISK
jgi:sugar phosphate permease